MRDSDVRREIERIEEALERKAENARELGLDYEPVKGEEHMNIDQLIEDVVTQLDKDPMEQMVDTETIIREYTKKIVNECIKELEISRRCDPYTGNLYECEYNTCIDEQIQVLKARFGVK